MGIADDDVDVVADCDVQRVHRDVADVSIDGGDLLIDHDSPDFNIVDIVNGKDLVRGAGRRDGLSINDEFDDFNTAFDYGRYTGTLGGGVRYKEAE